MLWLVLLVHSSGSFSLRIGLYLSSYLLPKLSFKADHILRAKPPLPPMKMEVLGGSRNSQVRLILPVLDPTVYQIALPFHGLSGLSSALPLLVLVATSRISPRQGGVLQ